VKSEVRLKSRQNGTTAKIKELQAQAAKAKGDVKAAKIDQSIAETCTDYERRSGKLKQAWELTKEALT
jgi:hypothetical protein